MQNQSTKQPYPTEWYDLMNSLRADLKLIQDFASDATSKKDEFHEKIKEAANRIDGFILFGSDLVREKIFIVSHVIPGDVDKRFYLAASAMTWTPVRKHAQLFTFLKAHEEIDGILKNVEFYKMLGGGNFLVEHMLANRIRP